MRCGVSQSFDLNMDEQKQLKEIVREVFQTKPRGRAKENPRRLDSKKSKAVSMF